MWKGHVSWFCQWHPSDKFTFFVILKVTPLWYVHVSWFVTMSSQWEVYVSWLSYTYWHHGGMLTVRDSLVLNLLLYSLIGLSVIGLTFIITLARFMWIWKPRVLVSGGNFVACCVWWLWTLEFVPLEKIIIP